MESKSKPEPVVNSPTAWFCTLEAAMKKQDWDLAAKAKRELARLGVRVRFTKRAESEAAR